MRRVARRAASSSAAVVVRQSVGGVLSTVEATASADGRSSDTLRIAHPNTVDDAAAAKGSAGASSLRQRSGSGGGALAESKRQLLSVFFPADYPSSVNGDYASFVGWQAVHHCASAANGVLASASLLCVKYIFFTLSMPEFSLYFNDIIYCYYFSFVRYAVGLGAGAIPTAGAVNWALKDGLGQLGTLLFGRAIAPRFDLQPRAWYFAASGMLNLALLIEISTMLVVSLYLFIFTKIICVTKFSTYL